jgi:hypothetical protein
MWSTWLRNDSTNTKINTCEFLMNSPPPISTKAHNKLPRIAPTAVFTASLEWRAVAPKDNAIDWPTSAKTRDKMAQSGHNLWRLY